MTRLARRQVIELAELLDHDFKHAFPDIPLRVLREAGTWVRLAAGGLNDEEPWGF
jgi:hypothetical protein